MSEQRHTQRLVILGRNSKVWMALKEFPTLAGIPVVAIGHAELKGFDFLPGDNVWVLSYSRSADENRALLEILALQPNINVIYVSSASTNVTTLTRCYNYPSVKQQAREDAVRLCAARVINIGWFYSDISELPAGRTAATSVGELAAAMLAEPAADDVNLFKMIDRPFSGAMEHALYRLYGALLGASGRFPCLLRPLDLVLRTVGLRWYGYLYLSNRLWSSTI
ncbi:hypothetical protein [Herbaspirillum robiniae]|uniref:RCK N-terminal domain-containing protein n=1 Tax=Herbaspirillum robiniae TaxID=2014887 RepID=A0ABX2LZN3_9BURK|nr:hypothetical protein [Herbaspirillum robiniae]NUU03203.1 hypothetical protein [Herbaspirillum robiniae]